MKRHLLDNLVAWKDSDARKPLLIRGARQVGKTYLVREFSFRFGGYVEVNFDLMPAAGEVFERDLQPQRIIRDLSLLLGETIEPGKTLLFFDEIQAAPKAVQSLRYFYEKLPQLHVIGAGSLLDFELERIGMPVGRVVSHYLYPLTFLEFLEACGEPLLVEEITTHAVQEPLSQPVHERLLGLVGEYMAVGGMPEAADSWITHHDLNRCIQIHRSIIDTYRQDFGKYARKFQIKYVEVVFNQIPRLMGGKLTYAKVSREHRSRDLQPALALLLKAGVAHSVVQSSGSGIPLGVEGRPDRFKVLFLDIGLAQTLMGAKTPSWILDPKTLFVNKGAVTEAFVGQELLGYAPSDMKALLYYWHREARGSSAEVDYLIQRQDRILPIEVKSGSPGRLQSLRRFLDSHPQVSYGTRLSAMNYHVSGDIHNYPLYAVSGVVRNA